MATVTEKTAIPTGIWKSDPVHSTVGFSVKHMVVATFRGSFTDFGVTLNNSRRSSRCCMAPYASTASTPATRT